MLKEGLYSEYLKKYREYKDKHKKVDELEVSVKKVEAEGKSKSEELELQKSRDLMLISDRKNKYERQLASVKKDGTNSSVVKEYSDLNLREINSLENDIRRLESSKSEDAKDLQKQKKQKIKELEDDKKLCQARLDDLMNGGDGSNFVKKFDENQLRQQLGQEKELDVARTTKQYDSSIQSSESKLQNLDSEYAGILSRELSYIENDPEIFGTYGNLNNKLFANELPQIISDSLAEPVEEVIQRKGINGGQDASRIARQASPLDDLLQYIPKGLVTFVKIGIPAIIGVAMFLFFLFSGVRFGFVATATNAIVTFLFWVLCVAIGFGILYGILGAIKGKVAGIIGGVIGAIIGLLIALNWDVTLPTGFTNAVEWIIKVILCAVVIFALWMLNSSTNVGNRFINLGMKLGFIKKAALTQQGYMIQENIDSYYVLLKYQEIIQYVVENNKQRQNAYLNSEIKRVRTEKDSAISSLIQKLNQENEKKIASEKANADASYKKYEQQQMDLIQAQDECMLELSRYDGRIQEATAEYDSNLEKSKQSYEKKITEAKDRLQILKAGLSSDKDLLLSKLERDIADCDLEYRDTSSEYDSKISASGDTYSSQIASMQNEIVELQKRVKPDFDAINELFMKIYRGGSPELEETEGVFSNLLYVFDDEELSDLQTIIQKSNNSTDFVMPVKIHEIRHDKNPIVFLYESNDSSKIATELYKFMNAINIGLYTINCKKIYDLYITDPVSKGINFKDQEKAGRLTIVDDIKELYEVISDSMDFVAAKGQKISIDELNRQLIKEGNDEEDINKFGKYKVVQFIVPEEESTQTTDFFSNDIWTKFETSKKHGFLPIFYIKRSEWESALSDENKFNSKFIMKLNRALGKDKDNIFVIDSKSVTISRYQK